VRELSLFSGAGGGLLGTKLLGWQHVGYVEWDDYCQRVIAQRIADGYLDRAPIFGDVREFAQSGAADQYRGAADVVSAGFPCQPFSVAGKQLAADDSRNMWPATAEVIRRVRPRSVLLENVRGLISCGYLGTVLIDLAALGYVGRWGVLGACDAGAPHKRDRLWIVAHAEEQFRNGRGNHAGIVMGRGTVPEFGNSDRQAVVGHPNVSRKQTKRHIRRVGRVGKSPTQWWRFDPGDGACEPELGRVAHGVAHRVDRLKAAGNGQVSSVVELAWRTLA
jgi:DNA (cytosine-5)-methyltransferase 1